MNISNSAQFLGLHPTPTTSILTNRHMDLLRLKWVSGGEVFEDFKGYLCINSTGERIATGANDRYLTGSNDSLIRLWNEYRCQAVLTGHSDWVRCMHLAKEDKWLLSGGMDGSVYLWDVNSLQKVTSGVIVGQGSMNSVQGISFSKTEDFFFAVTREGTLNCFDLRTFQPTFRPVSFTQLLCHSSKANNIQVSDSGYHLLTSARDSTVRLWDIRRLETPCQEYRSHVCKMFPICAKFIYNERYIVTGSEDKCAYIYDTLTGQVARKLEVGTVVTQTEPMSSEDLAFFVLLYQHQRLGLVDAAGTDAQIEQPTAEECLRERMKTAMQEALWETANQIYHHLRVIGRYNMIGYGNLLEVLQETAATDSGSRELLREINDKYERKMNQPLAPAAVPEPQPQPQSAFPRPQYSLQETPPIRIERVGMPLFPVFSPKTSS